MPIENFNPGEQNLSSEQENLTQERAMLEEQYNKLEQAMNNAAILIPNNEKALQSVLSGYGAEQYRIRSRIAELDKTLDS